MTITRRTLLAGSAMLAMPSIVRAQAPEIDIRAMYLGVIPFLAAPLVLIALLLLFPDLALWLPRQVR